MQRPDGSGSKHVGSLEGHTQQRILRRAFHPRPHRPAFLGAVGPGARHENKRHVGIEAQQRLRDRNRQVIGHAPIVRLRHPRRGDAQAVQRGIKALQPLRVPSQIEQIRDHQLLQLRMPLPRAAAAHAEHHLYARIQQALAQRALPDHARGAEEDDFHEEDPGV